MSAPPLKRPVLTCLSKQRWCDELAARAGAMHALERPGNTITRLWVYACPECRGWHLTSKGHGQRMMVTKTNPVQFDNHSKQPRRAA